MSKKRLSPDLVANELRGNSAFFPAPQQTLGQTVPKTPAQQGVPPTSRTVEPSLVHSTVPPAEPSTLRPFDRTTERTKVRHSFDVFFDQLLTLRQLALAREATSGKRVLLGDLVQEAIDMLLEKGDGKP
jgi:hypothetical protein